jgi:hypothetical protein
LPLTTCNRPAPEDNPKILCGPVTVDTATNIPQPQMPAGEMKQESLHSPDILLLQQASSGRHTEIPLAFARKFGGLDKVADKNRSRKSGSLTTLRIRNSWILSKPGHSKTSTISATTFRARFPVAVSLNPGPTAAARRSFTALRATADFWVSSGFRSPVNRTGPSFSDGGRR